MSVKRDCQGATTLRSAPTPGVPMSVPVLKALGLQVLANLALVGNSIIISLHCEYKLSVLLLQ